MALSLVSTIAAAIHYPEMDGIPLYPHVDGAKSESRDAKWLNKSKTTFNSPTNIKALYLFADKALVHYWQSPVSAGKRTQLTHSYAYRVQDKPFAFTQTLPVNSGSRVFGFLMNPYVLSNLEELWFDPVIFGISSGASALPKYNFAPGQVFGDAASLLIGELGLLGADAEKFPLLRTIVMFKGTPVIRSEHVNRITAMEGESGAARRRVITEDLTYLKEFAAKTRSSYFVDLNLKAGLQKMEARDYVFDDKYLKPFRGSLLAKYSGVAAATTEEPTVPVKPPLKTEVAAPTVSEFEAALLGLKQRGMTQKELAIAVTAYAKIDAAGLRTEYARFGADAKRAFGAFIERAVGKQ